MTTDCTETNKANEDCFDCQWSQNCRLLDQQPDCSSESEALNGLCLFYDKQSECDNDLNCIERTECLYLIEVG